MPSHDAYARLTPYELSFPNLEWARDAFVAVREESDLRGVDRTDPALFTLLGSVGRILQEIRPDDEDADHTHPFGMLLFHAFHFWEAGERIWLLETPVVRSLMESAPSAAWAGGMPAAAGYVQLPQHLVWMEGERQRPESIDGYFWSAPAGDGEIHVLLAANVLGDKGFSVVPLPPASLEHAEEWADRPGTEEPPGFASRMPGADLENLYRVGTPGEVLKLVSRVFAFLDGREGERPEPQPAGGGGPQPSRLAYRKVRLG